MAAVFFECQLGVVNLANCDKILLIEDTRRDPAQQWEARCYFTGNRHVSMGWFESKEAGDAFLDGLKQEVAAVIPTLRFTDGKFEWNIP